MSAEVHYCEQGSPEWRALRAGIPTASMFGTIMARGKDGQPSATRAKYMRQLAGEIITGRPHEGGYVSAHMERGRVVEPEALRFYAMETATEPQLVGFVTRHVPGIGLVGASPDALIDDDGALEIKSQLPDLLIERLLATGGFPPEHMAQCQGTLWVTLRQWCDVAIYAAGLPLFRRRCHRDELYLRKLEQATLAFKQELDEMVARLRAFGKV